MTGNIPLESTFLDCLEVKTSPIDGVGVFTSSQIAEGTVVIRWGGEVFTSAQLAAGLAREHTHVGIDDDLYLAIPSDKPPTLDDFMNHSCEGNVWMADAVTLIARRDIAPNEELTADYALWLNKPDYKMKRLCNCGSSRCRTQVTGTDWMLPAVQELYRGHFSPFINRLIDKQSSNKL